MSYDPDACRYALVIPAYREHERLKPFLMPLAEAIAASGLRVEILIVDDGSPDKERDLTKHLRDEAAIRFPFVLPVGCLPENSGKGAAVYAGWDASPDADMLAFADADGSVSPQEIVRLLKLADEIRSDRLVLIASRGDEASGRSFRRAILSRLFSSWVRFSTGLRVHDSQCGFKLVDASLYRAMRAGLHETGFAFDVELLLRAAQNGGEIREIPVRWTARPGGSLSLPSDGLAMLRAVRRMRRKD